jgi:hypothetical protein
MDPDASYYTAMLGKCVLCYIQKIREIRYSRAAAKQRIIGNGFARLMHDWTGNRGE